VTAYLSRLMWRELETGLRKSPRATAPVPDPSGESPLRVRSKCVDKGGRDLAKSARFLVRCLFDDTQMHSNPSHPSVFVVSSVEAL
jgi:hypothetical protein